MGNRRSEGVVLGNLADLLVQQGRIGDAQEALRAGEALLREVGDPLELAKLFCLRRRVEAAAGDLDLARAALSLRALNVAGRRRSDRVVGVFERVGGQGAQLGVVSRPIIIA